MTSPADESEQQAKPPLSEADPSGGKSGTKGNGMGANLRPVRPGIERQQGHTRGHWFFQIPTNKDERAHVHSFHGPTSWRAKVLRFLHRPSVEFTLMGLLMLDVIILFVELFIFAEFPSCTIVERDAISCCPMSSGENHSERWLASEHYDLCEEGSEGEYPATCDEHKYPGVHTTEVLLRSITFIILSIFMVELLLLIAACGIRKFMSHLFYVVDLVIVSVSLALEIVVIMLDESQLELAVGLLILTRVWRFVRIGHGLIATTHELTAKEQETRIEKLEALLLANDIEPPP
jgi:hypothetical protein